MAPVKPMSILTMLLALLAFTLLIVQELETASVVATVAVAFAILSLHERG